MQNMTEHEDYKIEAVKPKHKTVAIVGRPNVGKSALFNTIIGRKMAIVHSQSGVTRDRVAAMAEFGERRFMVVDTGGLGIFRDDKSGASTWDALIREQLHVALEAADRVIFVVDAQEGLQALDEEVARLLHESDKEVVIAVNKADNDELAAAATDFSQLGFPAIRAISCTHRIGIHALLDKAVGDFPAEPSGEDEMPLRIAVAGRPNVGKSSVINRLLGEERVIVSDVAGTTRDAIDVPFTISIEGRTRNGELIDTAGLRRKSKVDSAVEHFSMSRTRNAIRRADIVLVVLDATTPATAQDRKICRMVADEGKACMLLLNKWDLASQQTKQRELFHNLDYELPFMHYAERLTCCAVSGYNLKQLVPKLFEFSEQLEVEYPTSLVNRVVQDAVMRMPPPQSGKGRLKVYYATCKSNRPPTFLVFVNRKDLCPNNYQSYLQNQFVQAFGIVGIPVVLQLRNRPRDDENRSRPPSSRKPKSKPKAASERKAPRKGPKKGKGSFRKGKN